MYFMIFLPSDYPKVLNSFYIVGQVGMGEFFVEKAPVSWSHIELIFIRSFFIPIRAKKLTSSQ